MQKLIVVPLIRLLKRNHLGTTMRFSAMGHGRSSVDATSTGANVPCIVKHCVSTIIVATLF